VRLVARHFRHELVHVGRADVGRVADDQVEALAQPVGPIAEPEFGTPSQSESLGIGARDGERARAASTAKPGRLRQLVQQREQQAAGARAEIENPDRLAAIGNAGKRLLHDDLRLRPRYQRVRGDAEGEAQNSRVPATADTAECGSGAR